MQRVVTAAFLFDLSFEHLNHDHTSVLMITHVFVTCAGIFLLLGLWTPVCGTMLAVAELWIAVSCVDGRALAILLSVLSATLAAIGPGAWSMDARLFGRKHFEIPRE